MGLLAALLVAQTQAWGRHPGKALTHLLFKASTALAARAASRACSGGPTGPGGYHKIRLQPGPAERKRFMTVKEATAKLVENLRRTPVDTAKQFADCLTPAERGAVIYALRRQNTKEGVLETEEAFLEADSNMDGKLSREEFAIYMALKRLEEERDPSKAKFWPSKEHLATTALASAIPFVGFGFCDNAIMLMAGEGIESSLGVALGITTLAAAGLGNLISDVVGLGLADTIEAQARRFGVSEPPLTTEQLRMPVMRATRTAGAVVGVSVGCLLGMVPLLFFDSAKKAAGKEKKEGEGEGEAEPAVR